jgi:hypothetical protein
LGLIRSSGAISNLEGPYFGQLETSRNRKENEQDLMFRFSGKNLGEIF